MTGERDAQRARLLSKIERVAYLEHPKTTVFFDAGGVLVFPNPEILYGWTTEFDRQADTASLSQIAFAHAKAVATLDSLHHGKEERGAYINTFLHHLGEFDDVQRQKIKSCFDDVERHVWSGIFSDTAVALDDISALGYRMGVITNADGTVNEVLSMLGLVTHAPQENRITSRTPSRITCVVDSFDVGCKKPDPRIFLLACNALGVVPNECYFVGDRLQTDMHGAKAVGMTPIHFLHKELNCPEEHDHEHVASLEELVQLLRKLT